MKRKSLKIGAMVTAALFLVILALPHLLDVDRFRPQLESSLASALGREVHVGHMELSLLAGGAHVDQISVADDPAFSNGNFLRAKSLDVGVNLLSLISSHSLHVTSLTLDQAQLKVIKSAKGEWNFDSLGSTHNDNAEDSPMGTSLASPATIVLDRLKISNATIEITSGQPTVFKNIDVDLTNATFDGSTSFVLSAHTDAGKLEIKGEAGPMNRAHPDQTPFHATIKANKTDLGQVASLGSSSSLGGILNFDGTVTSDGTTVHSEGKVSAERLRLARGGRPASQTVSLQYATDYDVAENKGVIRNGEILIGKSPASLSGTYSARGKNVTVHVRVSGSHLPSDSVAGVLDTLGVALQGGSKLRGGTVDGSLSLDGPIDRVVTSGNAQITNAHFAGLDLGTKLSTLPGMSGLKGDADLAIVNLGTHFRIDPQDTHISGFNCQLGGIGNITGDGDVSSSHHLQFKMVAHVANDGAVRFGLNHVGLRNVPNDIPFQIVGTTSVPVIIPDLSGVAKKTTTAVAKNAAQRAEKSAIKKILEENPKSQPTPPVQVSNNKKGGFFHNLLHRRDKHTTAANNQHMASEKTNLLRK